MDYITGMGRGNSDYGLQEETHLYQGTFANPGLPMCKRGWNRDYGTGYSIWRNNSGDGGVCPVCEQRAARGLPGVGCRYPRKLKKLIKKERIPYTPLRPGLPLYDRTALSVHPALDGNA